MLSSPIACLFRIPLPAGRSLLKIRHLIPLHLLGCMLALCSAEAEIPKIIRNSGGGQLIVNGQPYLVLGGEVGNSSSGTSAQADEVLPRLAQMHINTVLIPVAWEQIEPTEGSFDFRILDHWIDTARQQHLHLALLWFEVGRMDFQAMHLDGSNRISNAFLGRSRQTDSTLRFCRHLGPKRSAAMLVPSQR